MDWLTHPGERPSRWESLLVPADRGLAPCPPASWRPSAGASALPARDDLVFVANSFPKRLQPVQSCSVLFLAGLVGASLESWRAAGCPGVSRTRMRSENGLPVGGRVTRRPMAMAAA